MPEPKSGPIASKWVLADGMWMVGNHPTEYDLIARIKEPKRQMTIENDTGSKLHLTHHAQQVIATIDVTPSCSASIVLSADNLSTLRAWFADGIKEPNTESVNHPAHYKQGGIECIDALQACLTPEEFRGFCKGNIIKYLWRERHKSSSEDTAKAEWYLNRLQAGGQLRVGD